MPLSPGSHLGPYEVLALIGAGGMGEVYRARDPRLDREVAIKVLPHDRVADETRRQRFVQEAKAASALNHPHIITIYEIESANEIDFLVMEYVRGKSLDALIPRQGMRLGEALRIAIAIADAVACAHKSNIVHRDLKPANVVVGADGAVKVLDFGLAKLITDDKPGPDDQTRAIDEGLTRRGAVMGTLAYMSPEQASGETVDVRSDVFSFGAMLYEMVTGIGPFAGKTPTDTMAAVLQAQPKPPSQIVPTLPRELERLILRCLRREPARRFQHMGDVKVDLEEIKEESDSGTDSAAFSGRRHRGLPIAVTVGVSLLVVLGAAWLLRPRGTVASPAMRVVPLTTLTGSEGGPTFSPDGEQVAFSWNGEKQDNFDIYLKLVGSSEVRRLTTDPADDVAARWSPDGRLIAFLRGGPHGAVAYVVSPVTGTERKIAELGQADGLSWSRDGRWLATSRFSQQDRGIDLVPTDGGEVKPFMRVTPPEWIQDAAFSPDGGQLAYVSCTAALRCQLQVVAVDGDGKPAGPPRTLTRQAGNLGATTWSVHGESVLFCAETVPYTTYLWRVPANGSQPPERIELAGIGAADPAISRAHDRMAFVQMRNSLTLHPLDSTFTSAAVLASSFWDFDAQFSPDGRQLVFSSSRSGEAVEIWIAQADGSAARQVTRGPGRWQGSPTWSPDGRQIVFDSQAEDGHWAIWAIDADGGVPHRVTRETGDQNRPAWSRDGQWVYFTAGLLPGSGAPASVRRVRISGGASEHVAPGGGYKVVVSPDGSEILFKAEQQLQARLLAVPAAGGVAREVLPCVVSYATTSRALYYVECGPGPELGVHEFDPVARHDRVIGRTRDVNALSALTVSPDGKTVLVARHSESADLMLIENFR